MSNNEMSIFDNMPAVPDNMFSGSDMDDLMDGEAGSFPRISIKGSKFRVKPPGEPAEPLIDSNGNVMTSCEFVIIDYQKGLSRNWYEKDYTDGDAEAPDCFSNDGKSPVADCTKRQANNCVTCEKSQWGSRVTASGKPAKDCRESKRLAVTFASNLHNTELGGPMLLRVPAVSLKDLRLFAKGMKAKNFPIQRIAVRIGFDVDASFPKLTFKAVRALTDDELGTVAELYNSEQVRDILVNLQHSNAVAPAPAPEPKVIPTVDLEFEEPPAIAAPQASSAPTPAPAAAAPEKPKPKKAADSSSGASEDMAAIMGELDIPF